MRSEAMNEFLREAGWGEAAKEPLAGDASTRRYVRLRRGGETALLMDQPQDAEAPSAPAHASAEERRALGYNAVARLAGADCERFIAASEFLRRKGLSAPEIYAAHAAEGFVLIEDFGDTLYSDVLARGEDEHALYANAIDALAKLHEAQAPASLPRGKPLFAYDETALLAETDLMTDWFLPLALGRKARPDEIAEHRALWQGALEPVLDAAPVFVHRDYHAQNLLWLGGREGAARVGLIDFQDAVAGTRSYDLISLLEDARRDVSPELAETMTKRYLAAVDADEESHRAEMAVMAAQRNAKIAGIFARLYLRDSKPRYLSYLPRVWGYLNRDLAHPALSSLRTWYDKTIPLERRGNPQMGETV
ncbi:MAG TPA: phosphotransferase [Rhizomicrobium sp.]|nr:phosphotransferase [Rhizomicrobium sp.]